MTAAPTIANIIASLALFVSILTAIFIGMQTNSISKQTTTAQGAADTSKKALCQTLETGFNVAELTHQTLLKGFTTPLTENQQEEYDEKLKIQEAYFKRLYADNDCPPRIGE
jgi:hypothetical protein